MSYLYPKYTGHICLSIPSVYRAHMSIYIQRIQGIYVYLYLEYTGHICLSIPKVYRAYMSYLYPKYTGHICLSIPKVYRAYMSIYTQSIQGTYVYTQSIQGTYVYTQSIQGTYVYLYPKYTGHICLSIPKVYRAYMSIL